jgi:hypothetical protein
LPRPAWTTILFYTSCHCWDDRHVPPHLVFFFFSLRWDLAKKIFFLSSLTSNHDSPDLSLLA